MVNWTPFTLLRLPTGIVVSCKGKRWKSNRLIVKGLGSKQEQIHQSGLIYHNGQIIWTLKSYKDAVPDKTIGHPLHHIMSTTRSSGVISNVAVEELCCPHSVSLLVAFHQNSCLPQLYQSLAVMLWLLIPPTTMEKDNSVTSVIVGKLSVSSPALPTSEQMKKSSPLAHTMTDATFEAHLISMNEPRSPPVF